MRVRVVEDDELIGSLLQVLLDSAGHQTVLTDQHFEDLLNPEPWVDVEAVVCDLLLNSTLSGVDILTYLKATEPQIRRVVLTAVGDVEPMMTLAREASDALLIKPAQIADVLAALNA